MGKGKQKYSGYRGYRGSKEGLGGKVNPKKKHYPNGAKPLEHG
jgi:hypothetical protein